MEPVDAGGTWKTKQLLNEEAVGGGGELCARECDELLSRRGYKSFILVPCSPFLTLVCHIRASCSPAGWVKETTDRRKAL